MTRHDPRLYLAHILESADLVASYVRELDLVAFVDDQQLQDAVVRRIEIIGEAVKNLPPDIRELNSDVPWKRIAGMRDKVIHDYMGVDVELVWAVTETLMPQLRTAVSRILDELNRSGGSGKGPG